jgi:hypothetical protein
MIDRRRLSRRDSEDALKCLTTAMRAVSKCVLQACECARNDPIWHKILVRYIVSFGGPASLWTRQDYQALDAHRALGCIACGTLTVLSLNLARIADETSCMGYSSKYLRKQLDAALCTD